MPNPKPNTKQHAVVNIHLNSRISYTYPDKVLISPFLPLSVVTITPQFK